MPRRADPDPPGLPLVVSMEQAQAAGLTRDQVRQRVRSGRWSALNRGVYLRSAPDAADEFEWARLEHVNRAVAVALTHEGAVVGLGSAAAVHRLPMVSGVPDRVHLVSATGRSGSRHDATVHRLDLAHGDVMVTVTRVTTPLRTWTDIARFGSLADSLAVGDRGLRSGAFELADLERVARCCVGRGCRQVRLAATLVDAGHETPLESFSAARFHEWGVPMPRSQVVIEDDAGRFVGRVDFLWDEAGVVGEADGALKYDDRRAHYDQKRREDRLRALGFRVIRWGWGDLVRGGPLRSRLLAVLT